MLHRYLDLNGINASIWEDVPLESDEDKSPIVLIAKPFALPIGNVSLAANETTTANGNATELPAATVKLNQTDDFFTATNEGPIERMDKALSSPAQSSFFNYNLASFRKKFFSRLIPL